MKKNMMSRKPIDVLYGLILFSLMGMIVWHVGESISLLTGSLHDQVSIHTPFILIGIKYLMFVGIFLLLFYIGLRMRGSIGKGWMVASFLLAWGVISFLLSKDGSVWSFLCGMKWLIPMIGVVFFLPVVNEENRQRLLNAMFIILVSNLIFQVFQVFFMHSWYGLWPRTHWAARPPGFFFIPSSAAFFVCSAILLMLSLQDKRRLWALLSLGFVSVFLTLSGTGFTVMLVILGVLLSGKLWQKTIPFIIPASYAITKILMPYFRGDSYFEISLGTRTDILSGVSGVSGVSVVSGVSGVSGVHFGSGTASAWLLKLNWGLNTNPIMTDSFLAQIAVNLGNVALFLYVLILALGAVAAWLNDRPSAFLWMIALGMFSVTFPITESFPTFLIVAYGIAFETQMGSYRLDSVLKLFDRVKHCRA